MQVIKVNFSIHWYTVLLILVELGLVAFGAWALIDSVNIGSTVAGCKFFLLFFIWSLPGLAVLLFFRPKEGDLPKSNTVAQ
ncbi:MAG: hypothetical protein ABFD97_00015 [Syntrophobacter sp.]